MTSSADPELLSLYLRIFFDEDVSANIVANLRQRGFGVSNVRYALRLNLADDEQLAFAVSEKRTLLTHNRNDFEELHKQYVKECIDHYRIIIAKRRSNDSLLISKLLNLIDSTSPEPMVNQLKYI